MSLTFKLLSLAIRTVAKPIGNQIKRQAKEHDGFRRFAINQAQRVHRIDMRMRLGILHDPEAQQRMHEREQRAAEERKKKEEAPTVRSEEEQKKYDERKARETQDEKDGKKQEKSTKVKIRPLSDARAIELGANFFSEAFIFMVAVGLILLENWRSSRKSSQRRDEVADRLDALEAQVERLQQEHHLPELEALNEKIKRARAVRKRNQSSWYNPFSWFRTSRDEFDDDDDDYEGVPGEIEGQKPDEKASAKPPDPATKEAKATNALEKPTASTSSPPRVDSVKADSKQR